MGDTVRYILSQKGNAIWFVDPDSTVYDALVLLADKDVGALLVVAGRALVGIFSERDYARKVFLLGHSSKDMAVREVMTSPVITVTPEHSVADCMRIMTHHRIRHLPVVEGEELVGIVSIGDLVNAIISEQAETIEHLTHYISGTYPS